MTILTKEEKRILEVELDEYYYSNQLRRALNNWRNEKNLKSTNYEERLQKNIDNIADELSNFMDKLKDEKIIIKENLAKACHKYEKFNRWVEAAARRDGKSSEDLDPLTFWDYTIAAILTMLGVGIIEDVCK